MSDADREYVQSLARYRAQIDGLDEQIIALFSRRLGVSEAVGALKAERGNAVGEEGRAEQVLDRYRQAGRLSQEGLAADWFARLGELILDASAELQDRIIDADADADADADTDTESDSAQ
ncbi:chorismate mutase [Streptomyces sp. NPDC002130]|uniref:chorismate mutase n=1 Tax=Streptomyces sp. NPDC002130 TaxID=3155568 RepID=UPI0033339A80